MVDPVTKDVVITILNKFSNKIGEELSGSTSKYGFEIMNSAVYGSLYKEFYDHEKLEDLHYLSMKAIDTNNIYDLLEIFKDACDICRELDCVPGDSTIPSTYVRLIADKISLIVTYNSYSGVRDEDRAEAHLDNAKECYKKVLKNMLDVVPLVIGSRKVRKFTEVMENEVGTVKNIKDSIKAIKMSNSEMIVKYEDGHLYVKANHPEIDELFRTYRNDYLDYKRNVRKAVKDVKNQIMNMF